MYLLDSNPKSDFSVRSLNLGGVGWGVLLWDLNPESMTSFPLGGGEFSYSNPKLPHPATHLYSGVETRMSRSSSELSITGVKVM